MDTDSTLYVMSQFDFSNPIDVTITFEDSDTENDPHDTNNIQEKKSVKQKNVLNSSRVSNPNSYELSSPPLIDDMNNGSNPLRAMNLLPNYINSNYSEDRITQGTEKNVEISNDNNLHHYIIKHKILSDPVIRNEIFNKKAVSDNKISGYIQKILISVSHNILCILKAYRRYKIRVQILKNHANSNSLIQSSYNDFRRAKYHFFTLSYSILMTLFLPEHKSSGFNDFFLMETLKMAEVEGFQCTHQELASIYSEMMQWVTVNHKKLNNIPLDNVNNCNNRQERRKSLSSNRNSRCTRQHKQLPPYRDPKLRNIFSSGPPGSEVPIPVDNRFITISTNAHNTGSVTNLTHSSDQRYEASQNGYLTNINNYSCLETPRSELNNAVPIQNNHYLQIYKNATFPSIPPRPPTYVSDQSITNNYGILITDVRTEEPENISPVEYRRISTTDQTSIRSSISRDSGIISPPNFNSTTEQTCTINEEIRSEYFYPQLKTADISCLNADGSLINAGWCHTCGKNTNTKCLKCYKTYYCSRLCLSIDWTSHRNICNMGNAT